MQVKEQENEKYRKFVSELAQEMVVFDFQPDTTVWHYTNGSGFLGILQSGTIFASQGASPRSEAAHAWATPKGARTQPL